MSGLIGWERELYDKPAGFRTNTLICVGSTLFTIFSLKIGAIPGADSARVAAQIVSGIGFLGAGAIIRRGEAVLGLTTADSCGLKVLGSMQVKSDNRYIYEITLSGKRAEHNPLLEKLLKSPTVKEVRS